LGIEYLLLDLSVLKQLLDGLLYFNVAPGLPNSTQEKDDINIPGTRAIVIWRLLGPTNPLSIGLQLLAVSPTTPGRLF